MTAREADLAAAVAAAAGAPLPAEMIQLREVILPRLRQAKLDADAALLAATQAAADREAEMNAASRDLNAARLTVERLAAQLRAATG